MICIWPSAGTSKLTEMLRALKNRVTGAKTHCRLWIFGVPRRAALESLGGAGLLDRRGGVLKLDRVRIGGWIWPRLDQDFRQHEISIVRPSRSVALAACVAAMRFSSVGNCVRPGCKIGATATAGPGPHPTAEMTVPEGLNGRSESPSADAGGRVRVTLVYRLPGRRWLPGLDRPTGRMAA